MSILKIKFVLIVTNIGYPFGGGEEFIYRYIKWTKQLG